MLADGERDAAGHGMAQRGCDDAARSPCPQPLLPGARTAGTARPSTHPKSCSL